jgi:hypothetical protein
MVDVRNHRTIGREELNLLWCGGAQIEIKYIAGLRKLAKPVSPIDDPIFGSDTNSRGCPSCGGA